MNKYIIISTCLYFTMIVNSQNSYPQNFFSSPIDFKIAIAGTFGELRTNHFHSGIDIKTKQKKNIPIYASQDGYISRIKISTYGFGKALYINHVNSLTTVYAHLEQFNSEIQKKAESRQYEKESFEIDFSLQSDEIKIKKGDVIGYSGNTGSSTAPHLHFEIRDSKTQKIINPMLFGLPILDRTCPIINSILVYHTNGKKELIKTKKINENKYELVYSPTTENLFNIGINTYDLLDAAPNKNGVYGIELYVDDTLYFSNQMTTFSFSETRFINSHIDYEYHKKTGLKFQKCFLDLNNQISTNQKYTSHNIGDFSQNKSNKIKIIVTDSYNNTSTLIFNMNLKDPNQSEHIKDPQLKKNIINSKQIFEFRNDECEIYIPNNSLYKDYTFVYNKKLDSTMTFPVHQILHDSIPSHKNFILSIQSDLLPKELRKKAIIARLMNNKLNCIKSKWEDNQIIGQSNKFGDFTIVIDTIKPTIEYNSKVINNTIQVKISDQLSGIKKYRGEIDGKWILMEYDFKTSLLKYNFKEPATQKKHTLTVTVSDYVNNTETVNIQFFR